MFRADIIYFNVSDMQWVKTQIWIKMVIDMKSFDLLKNY